MRKIAARAVAVVAVVLLTFGINVSAAHAHPRTTAPPDVTVEVCDSVSWWDIVIFLYNCERRG